MNKVRRDMPRQLDHLHRTGAVVFGLGLGAWGRFTGRLPDDNPYQHERHPDDEQREALPTIFRDPADIAAARELAEAERAVAQHTASPEVVARIHALRDVGRPEERVQRWRASHA